MANFPAEFGEPVGKTTVYQATLRFFKLQYMPQFTDLNNSATLRVSNEILLPVRLVLLCTCNIPIPYFLIHCTYVPRPGR